MINIDRRALNLVDAIEIDLRAARAESRFEDVLECLDEILVHHKHTESGLVRSRCEEILRGA
ncbi:hypothetical protein JQ628_23545 [Bradyrhizobium lablabi]|uniref:hypothetical protein n=1 Tax=Bradyrhizobium lablabi TaxID=722472 RepID=UPI001BA665FC|nr:hypothetical protein [Bradyrhizobium lablabi]MBR1124521.1 hypothetical protein [Bradyrhizobium lablabi]